MPKVTLRAVGTYCNLSVDSGIAPLNTTEDVLSQPALSSPGVFIYSTRTQARKNRTVWSIENITYLAAGIEVRLSSLQSDLRSNEAVPVVFGLGA
jgi:hypothetical protein